MHAVGCTVYFVLLQLFLVLRKTIATTTAKSSVAAAAATVSVQFPLATIKYDDSDIFFQSSREEQRPEPWAAFHASLGPFREAQADLLGPCDAGFRV